MRKKFKFIILMALSAAFVLSVAACFSSKTAKTVTIYWEVSKIDADESTAEGYVALDETNGSSGSKASKIVRTASTGWDMFHYTYNFNASVTSGNALSFWAKGVNTNIADTGMGYLEIALIDADGNEFIYDIDTFSQTGRTYILDFEEFSGSAVFAIENIVQIRFEIQMWDYAKAYDVIIYLDDLCVIQTA